MLAYAASRPAPVERRPHPNTMLAIIAAHVAVVAVVMSAKMDLPVRFFPRPTVVTSIEIPKPTRENPQTHQNPRQSQTQTVDHTETVVSTLPHETDPFDTGPITPPNPGQALTGATGTIELPPPHFSVKLGPQLLTPASELKPPYPASKLITEEEATLRLKLTIDEHGRVVAVDPVGSADRAFLDAARRYLIAHWRYKAATEDGRAVASSMVITLRFQLDG
ncbi:MAG TPA: energy transducer TonB [Sphingomicrobium sp.]